ncbi:MAG: hypothetical protein RLZZ519_377, partial [Bacteroidota bacterium]
MRLARNHQLWFLQCATVPYGTTAAIQINGAEADGGLCFGDDNVCGGYSTRRTVTSTDLPPCQWNYFVDDRTCDIGTYGLEWSIYWKYAFSPTLTGASPANQVRCQGQAPTVLTATSNTDANGRPLARWYKWQISNSPNGPWSDIPGTQNGTENTTLTSFSYTPFQISGTRYYRFAANSNCTADYNNFASITNFARVTYAFPAAGAYSTAPGGYPFGTGDAAPAIVSGVCGATVLPGQTTTLNVLQEPLAGAAVNFSSISWTASGGSPTSGTGTSFTWNAPLSAGSYTISVTYNYAGCVSSTVNCAVTVGSANCSFAYVATTGSDVTTAGGPNNPYRTLAYALTQLGGRNYIRMAAGTYNETSILNIPSNVTIEGGYSQGLGNWVKSSAVTTTIIGSGSETIDANTAHNMGFKANGTSGWVLQDLAITTTAASGQTSSGRGKSNYGLYLNNASNYNIVRCVITAGAASNGANGAAGANGANGANGGQGLTDSCNDDDFLAGGGGGAGGVNAWGGNGGTGGRGGNAAGQSRRSRGCNGGAGATTNVAGGAGGTSPGTPCQDNYASGNSNGDGTNDNAGGGTAGTPSYAVGVKATASHSFGLFYVPSTQAGQGGHGSGGGAGSGGGSSGGESCT